MPLFNADNRRLYRCTVLPGLLVAIICGGSPSDAQELIPRSTQRAEAGQRPQLDRRNPFLDDRLHPTTLTASAPTLDRLHAPLLRRDLKIQAAQSCASASCHAGPRPGVTQPSIKRGAAFQLWRDHDPHARSWRTICSDESVAMMQRLKILDGYTIIDREGFDNCLACHNTTKRFDEPRSTVQLREGIGCAGCHGPSERWIHSHYQYDWSSQSAQHDGFVNAGDLYTRARMCASCHVGDQDRDMNHDLIAAGHPTLRYELATYHAWQPKHWRDPESSDRTAYEARLWLAGQIASTDAALSLLETRANDAHTVSEWPEFAAYNCASCHHNLGLENDRNPIAAGRKATAIYSRWNDAGVRWLLEHRVASGQATTEDRELQLALDAVRQQMETRPRPDAQAVAAAASEARQVLAAWFDSASGVEERNGFRSDRLGQLIATAAGNPNTFESWESAVQFYLAAVAARESWPGGWNGPLRNPADRIQSGLRYPEMIDISRYAERTMARAPTATRSEIAEWGIKLAQRLGPVKAWVPKEPALDHRGIEAGVAEALERVRDQLPTKPKAESKPSRDRLPTEPPARQPAEQPPTPDTPQPRESIEDIRRAIEELQFGGRPSEAESNDEPEP